MRMISTGLVLAVAFGALVAQGADEHHILKGLAYGPFRDGQQPGGVYPSEAQIRADLALIKRIAPKIRTYGTENILDEIPGFCEDIGLDCYPGAWLDSNLPSNDQQIADLLAVAAQNYATTKALIVGNEVLLRGDLTPAALANYINTVKASTTLPVTTADTFDAFLNPANDPVANAVDFLTIHIHPWWYNITNTNAAGAVQFLYSQVTNRWPGKQVVIGEVGWPSSGTAQPNAVPSQANFGRFMGEPQLVANYFEIDYFYFSAFDENWKVEPLGVGPHWGIMHADRTPKAGLNGVVEYYTSILSYEPGAITFDTFSGAKYEVQMADSLAPPTWGPLETLWGASDTNATPYAPPAFSAPMGAYRLRWVPD